MRLYNTLTRSVEPLVLRDPGRLAMYVCGPTVQDAPHFGHARAEIVPDVLRRYLEWTGIEVFHVRNITDVDDKIIARADREGRDAAEVAERYGRLFTEQMARLGVLPPHVAPRATGHILEMIELIERLIANGAAYEAAGDVLFRVRSFDGYGKLSGRRVDELRSGARVEVDERKDDPLDFALWKAAKPGEPSWASPWGRGRPGWHIECSAMAGRYLGSSFDLHGGGADLVFPHHENEIAQSEAATKEPFARHWLHNGMLTLRGEKMSKSVGNVVTLLDALDRYGADVIRFFFLAVSYRTPVDLSEERLAEAGAAIGRWQAFLRATARLDTEPADAGPAAAARQAFSAALEDDLGTPGAHAALFDLVSAGNAQLAAGEQAAAAASRDAVRELAGVLGYGLSPDASTTDRVSPLVEALLEVRDEARARKDFATADAIRARLTAAGVVVADSRDGARWHLS
jgi:cysteinyl-tRNA synthetase